MPDVDAAVGLDLSQAVSDVSDLASQIESSLSDAFSLGVSGFDISGAVGQVDDLAAHASDSLSAALAEGTAGFDVSGAAGQVDDLAAHAQAAISDALTSGAEAADFSGATGGVEGLGAAAEQATPQVEGAAQATGGLNVNAGALAGGAQLASGKLGGLSGASSALTGTAGKAAGGALALGAGIGVLFQKGLEAESALQRFNFIVGDMAEQVLNVNVGSLNANLDELAIKLGTDDEALRNANASLFQFALNGNASRQEAADFASNLTALAARAVALNPALGDVASVADSMSQGLGRARAISKQYGISLSQDEINTRALGNTSKATAAELTPYERSVASAELAIAKYGGSLDKVVNEGSKNAIIQQRSLKEQLDNVIEAAGRPLVAPVLELFEEAIPTSESLAKVLGTLAQVSLPILQAGLAVLGPVLGALGDGLEFISSLGPGASTAIYTLAAALATASGQPVLATVAGILALGSALGLLSAPVDKAGDALEELSSKSDKELREIATNAVAALTAFGDSVDPAVAGLALLDVQLDKSIGTGERFGQALVDSGVITAQQLAKALTGAKDAEAQRASDQERGTEITGEAGTAFEQASAAVDAYRTSLDELNAGRSDQFAAATALAQANQDLLTSFVAAKGSIDPYTEAGAALRDSLVGSADAARDSSAAILLATNDQAAAQVPLDQLRAKIEGLARAFGIDPGPLLQSLGLIAPAATETSAGIDQADIPGRLQFAVQSAAAALYGGVPALGAAGRAAGTGAASGVKSGIAPLPGIAGQAVNTALGNVRGLGSPAYDAGALIGAQIGDGVRGGLASRTGLVASQMRTLVDTAIQAGVDAAKSASPSKESAAQVGVPLAQGVAVGITSGTRGAVTAAQLLVGNVLRGMRGAVAGNLGGVVGSAGSGVPGITDVLNSALRGASGEGGFDPATFGRDLLQQQSDIRAFYANVAQIQKSSPELAAALAAAGPDDLGARTAAGLAAQQPVLRAAWEKALVGVAEAQVKFQATFALQQERLQFLAAASGDKFAKTYAQRAFGKNVQDLTEAELNKLIAVFAKKEGALGDEARDVVAALGASRGLPALRPLGTLPSAGVVGSPATSVGGIGSIDVREIRIVVQGVSNPGTARAAGRAAGEGMLDALTASTNRRVTVGVRAS